ncbi:MAG: abortive infection system antitoxin AbiGi family protein [Oleispira sp.]
MGLKKEWASKEGLNPVFYTNKSSPFTTSFIKSVEGIYKSIEDVDDPCSQIVAQQNYMDILNTYSLMKNYEGGLKRRNGKTTRNYRFSDEREWRYVPSITDNYFPFIPIENIDIDEKKARFNLSISHLHLEFCPDNIKYLIIESDADINRLIDHLESVKGRFDVATRRRLASRILTAEQINSDV